MATIVVYLAAVIHVLTQEDSPTQDSRRSITSHSATLCWTFTSFMEIAIVQQSVIYNYTRALGRPLPS